MIVVRTEILLHSGRKLVVCSGVAGGGGGGGMVLDETDN